MQSELYRLLLRHKKFIKSALVEWTGRLYRNLIHKTACKALSSGLFNKYSRLNRKHQELLKVDTPEIIAIRTPQTTPEIRTPLTPEN